MTPQIQLDTQVLIACRTNDIASAASALEQGANPNAILPGQGTEEERTLLSRAIRYNAPQIVELLLQKGAMLQESLDDSPCYQERLCEYNNRPECLLKILESGRIFPRRRHMEWALDWKHQGLKNHLVSKGVSDAPISYDVDKILAADDSVQILYKLTARLPESFSVRASELWEPEIIARDIWSFHCSLGSGIQSAVCNADFENLHLAHEALKKLPPTNALQTLGELEILFARYRFPEAPKAREEHMASLLEKFEKFESDLSEFDENWVSGQSLSCLWNNTEYLDAVVKNLRKHVDVLRKRRS